MKNNVLIIGGDTAYVVNSAYIAGALAMRNQIPWNCCPYTGEQAEAWAAGHENESAGEHIRAGVDVLYLPRNGAVIKEDTSVPRDSYGSVDKAWYQAMLDSCTAIRSLATA